MVVLKKGKFFEISGAKKAKKITKEKAERERHLTQISLKHTQCRILTDLGVMGNHPNTIWASVMDDTINAASAKRNNY